MTSIILPGFQVEIPDVNAQGTSTVQLWVDGFDNSRTGWNRYGDTPYLDAQDQPDNYVEGDAENDEIGDFTFQDLASGTVQNVTLKIYCYCDLYPPFAGAEVYLWNGSWVYVNDIPETSNVGSWNWESYDVSSILNTLEKVNNAKIYFKAIGSYVSSYPIKVDAAYLEVIYEPAVSPAYSNLSPENNYVSESADEAVTFSCYWQAIAGNLSHYIFSYKIGEDGAWTNETYSFPEGVTEAWSNITKSLNDFSNSEGKWIYWKFYANNTEGNWKATETRRLFRWESLPPVSRFSAGSHAVRGLRHIFFNGSLYGGKEAIYTVYMNTSYSPWKYQMRVFDMESYTWYGPFNISDSPSSDTHLRPAISVLPDGRLIILYGYLTPLGFRISLYSAKTETNLTKLCSNWSVEHQIDVFDSPNCFAYPYPVRFDDTLLVFGRAGVGNFTFYKWVDNSWIYTYVKRFDNSTYVGDWSLYGYGINEFGLRLQGYWEVTAAGIGSAYERKLGAWTFRKGYSESMDTEAYLEILANASGNSQICSSWNTTWQDVSESEPTWLSWKVTGKNWNDTLEYIKVQGSNNIHVRIYCIRLKLKIIGFSPSYIFIWRSSTYTGLTPPLRMYLYPSLVDNKIFVAGCENDGTYGNHNIHFVYSDDKGETWKLVNGTSIGIPIRLDEIKVLDMGGVNGFQITAGPTVMFDSHPIVAVHRYNHQIKGYVSPVQFAYYNASLGQPGGSWIVINCTYENGTLIYPWKEWVWALIQDPYYNRPSLWLSTGERIKKLVCLPTNFSVFREVYTDNQLFIVGAGFSIIQDSPEAYEVVSINNKLILGYTEIGEFDEPINSTSIYGCKFTVNQSGYLSSVLLYQSPINAGESSSSDAQAAIYNSSFHLIAVSQKSIFTTGCTFYDWHYPITFPDPVYLEAGETYWLVFRVEEDGKFNYAYTTGTTNQTFHYTGISWTDDFPQQLNMSDMTFYDRKISVFGYETLMIVRGLGHDVWATEPTHIGVEGTFEPEQTVTFHTYWTDNSHLDYAVFYWNASGSMSQNGTLDWVDNPTEAWSNFTRIIPPDSYGWKIAWYIVAYDIYGNSGNTSLQILNVCMLYSLTFDEALGVDFERRVEVSISRTCTLTFSDSSFKSLEIAVIESFNAFVSKFERVSLVFTQILDFAHLIFKNVFMFPSEIFGCSGVPFQEFC